MNNWTLSWDCISPDLKHKHSDQTFKKNFIKKIKHKNVNLCDKNHNLVKKRHKIINLCDKKSQPSEKKMTKM